MIGTTTLASLISHLPGVRLIRRPFEPSQEPFFATADQPEALDSEIVEGSALRVVDIQPSEQSGFTHFIDGAQVSRPAFYDGPYPGYLAFINAAVLAREGSQVSNAPIYYAQRFAVFAPSESKVLATIFQNRAHDCVPVECRADLGMSGMAEAVRNAISTARQQLEHELKNRWLEDSHSGWLLVDGGIAQLFASNPGFHPIVGVVKSHRKQYFREPKAVDLVLGLKPGQRTTVFKAVSGSERRDVAWSWYLRLRDDPTESPAFGLVRVEMPPDVETLRWVDEVSAWLLAERSPISLPDYRFDRLLYPIRLVETHLKARQPSEAVFVGLIGI